MLGYNISPPIREVKNYNLAYQNELKLTNNNKKSNFETEYYS